jgi:hypothetical protein
MVKLCAGPVQLFASGVTMIVAVTGALDKFMAVNDGISPLPVFAKPMEVLSLVQLKLLPLTAPVKLIAFVDEPVHKVWLAG